MGHRNRLTELVGTPFQYGARGPDAFDCYGLVMECWRRTHGAELSDFLSPTDQGAQAAVGAIKLQQWKQVPCAAGVMAAIRIGRLVSHCGFMLDDTTMIHAWDRSGGVTAQRIDDPVFGWTQRITGFYTYVG